MAGQRFLIFALWYKNNVFFLFLILLYGSKNKIVFPKQLLFLIQGFGILTYFTSLRKYNTVMYYKIFRNPKTLAFKCSWNSLMENGSKWIFITWMCTMNISNHKFKVINCYKGSHCLNILFLCNIHKTFFKWIFLQSERAFAGQVIFWKAWNFTLVTMTNPC